MSKIIKTYYTNGNIKYEYHYLNAKLHREDGPAYIRYDKNGNILCESYYIKGRYHKEDGPAIISWDKDGNILYKEYYLNDKHLTEQEWYNQLSVENKLKFAFGLENN